MMDCRWEHAWSQSVGCCVRASTCNVGGIASFDVGIGADACDSASLTVAERCAEGSCVLGVDVGDDCFEECLVNSVT